MSSHCPFCQIVSGQEPARIVFKDEQATAFQDARPVTPVHILIIPNRHIESINQVSLEDEKVLGHLMLVAKEIASQIGVSESGYRLVVNTGPDAGQTVFHVHMHLLAGKRMPFRFYGEG